MLFYDISIFLKPIFSGLKHRGLGKSAKRADDKRHTGSELTVNHSEPPISFFFSIFFGWQWGYHGVSQGEDDPGEQLERWPHRFPARHLCDSVNS